MTLEKLENEWELSSYNENTNEQLDYYMDLRKHDVGDKAYLYSHEDNELREMKIVNIIVRSDNPTYYDGILENDDVLIDGEDKYDADTSAEFITDYDCYLVWFEYTNCNNTEAVEICPHCMSENIYPMYDIEKDGYVTKCKHCGKEILLCDECLHSEDNKEQKCDWCETECGGKCFRGITK